MASRYPSSTQIVLVRMLQCCNAAQTAGALREFPLAVRDKHTDYGVLTESRVSLPCLRQRGMSTHHRFNAEAQDTIMREEAVFTHVSHTFSLSASSRPTWARSVTLMSVKILVCASSRAIRLSRICSGWTSLYKHSALLRFEGPSTSVLDSWLNGLLA